MSIWSRVTGVIVAETISRSTAEAMYIAQTVVNHLPKIYGSEGCAKFYINALKGLNTSSNVDEFNKRSNLMQRENQWGLFEWQTKILITVEGSLRDASFQNTLRETTRMLSRLSSRLWVKSCLISVSSDKKQFIFHDPDWIIKQELTDWVDHFIHRFPRGFLKNT